MFVWIALFFLLILLKRSSRSVEIVLAKYKEDVSWTSRLKYPYVIYSKHANEPNYVKVGTDNEGSSYLHHIVENYDRLSDWTLFMHAHETHWHHPSSAVKTCNDLDFNKLYQNRVGFHQLNHAKNGNIMTYKNKKHQPSELTQDEYLQVCSLMFTEDEVETIRKSIQNGITFPPSAQFVVHRTRILSRPKEFYEKCLSSFDHPLLTRKANAKQYNSRSLGAFFYESMWHFIFGESFVYKPEFTNFEDLLR